LPLAFLLLMLYGCSPELDYSGERTDGRPHGYGILIHPNGALYEGEFADGKRHGTGRWLHPNGTTYEGEWNSDLYHGWGTLTIPGGVTYEGQWEYGIKQGFGIQIWRDEQRYEGSWNNDLMHGSGTLYYPDGSHYTGAWEKGRKHGPGILYHACGEVLAGEWEKDNFLYIPVEIFALSATELSISMTDTGGHRITSYLLPANATNPIISWSSSNPQVAEVIDGVVYPHSTGSAVVTALALAEELEAECLISVLPPPVFVTAVTLDRTWLNLLVGGDAQSLRALVEPENATDKQLLWRSENPGVASVNQSGLVTPQQPGETEIIVQTADGGFTASCRVRVRNSILPEFDSGL
jgi:hypothetical protein